MAQQEQLWKEADAFTMYSNQKNNYQQYLDIKDAVSLKSVFTPEMENRNSEAETDIGQLSIVEEVDEDIDDQEQRHNQLQDDVEMLALHLEQQMLERQEERVVLQRDLLSLRTENEALKRQMMVITSERDEWQQKALEAADTQEELLLALREQQQREEKLQTAYTVAVGEKAQMKKALDTAQLHARRLEEDVAKAQTLAMHLQNERQSLQAIITATTASKNSRETTQLQLQEELIQSLRDDLLQMEFEFKTLTLDKITLEEQVAVLQKRLGNMDSKGYEIIPLDGKDTKHQKQQQQQNNQKKRITLRPCKKRNSEINDGLTFGNLMELPNFVGEHQCHAANHEEASIPGEKVSRRQPAIASIVSKTMLSAKKKLFVPSAHPHNHSHHHRTVVLPQ